MYASFVLSTILIFYIHGGLTIDCPKSPAKWCKTKDIAKACDVIEQCNSFVWKVRDGNDKVNFTLYYETLCPDCRQFIKTELYRAYNSILDIVNITLVPYGNAHETYQPATQDYEFVCQHGPDECLGNLIHTCVLTFYPSVQQHMPFIYCTESTAGDVTTVAKQCAEKTKIDFSRIDACTQTKIGNLLQHTYAAQTESLQPPHQYVPWVTVNGEHTEDIQKQAEKDLIGLICKSYKGPDPPAQCTKNL